MTRGDVYRVRRPPGDPKPSRVYVIVSRQPLIESRYSTVICAPVFTTRDGLETEVEIGAAEGLKHPSSIHCDGLVSIAKARLTDYVSHLSPDRLEAVDQALRAALAIG